MKLYRINYTGDSKLNRYTEMLIENGQLVEAKKCVHGKYDAHYVRGNGSQWDPFVMCPGVGLEEPE